ncbi:MAG: sugar transferase [Actinomycetota bacterium]
MKRALDVTAAGVALVLAAPLLALAAIGIKLSSRGPVLHRAVRAGRDGEPFEILKLRTMRLGDVGDSRITVGGRDPRVFAVGVWLRKLKVDELPQLVNILRGDMAVVGPRPEAVDIVRDHYATEHMRTLDVAPGLASPGSLWNYTHGEALIGPDDPEGDYLRSLLPVKLALELVYVDRASLRYDLELVFRTLRVILQTLSGRSAWPDPPELAASAEHVHPVRNPPPDRATG